LWPRPPAPRQRPRRDDGAGLDPLRSWRSPSICVLSSVDAFSSRPDTMNYRHAFHAGNLAAVHKHVVLLSLLAHLHRKPKPILYLDTHAGRGRYDLRSTEAARGREWQ